MTDKPTDVINVWIQHNLTVIYWDANEMLPDMLSDILTNVMTDVTADNHDDGY